ncbi:hypothetical protein NXX23_18215 [Bacteroides ovatus]|nr:hypothetical protein [Bacteroides ovatus]
MIQELFSWLDAQRITYIPVDTEVVDIPGFGRLFTTDLSGVESIFRGDGDKLVFNLMESPDVLMEEGIFHVPSRSAGTGTTMTCGKNSVSTC